MAAAPRTPRSGGFSPRVLDCSSVEAALWAWQGPRPLVDLSRLHEFDAFGFLVLVLLGRILKERGGELRLLVPENRETHHRLGATPLASLLQGAYWTNRPLEMTSAPPPFTVVQVKEEEGVTGLVNQLGDELSARFPFGDRANRMLIGALFELLQNIPQHAAAGEHDLDPFGLAAVEEDSHHIHVVVADKGVGLAGSLRLNPRYRHLTPPQALEAVLVDGASRLDKPGRGGTLRKIREVVKENAGRFYVRSGEAAFLQQDVEWSVGKVLDFPGVQISVRLPRTLFEPGEEG